MARPIWTGTLSRTAQRAGVADVRRTRKVDLQFRMLDRAIASRSVSKGSTPTPARKCLEGHRESLWVRQGSYRAGGRRHPSAAPESHEAVEVESFVDAAQIDPRYYEKPYLLVPGKKAEKGYVLLRETLRIPASRHCPGGGAHAQYLCAVMPHADALVLMILRYPQGTGGSRGLHCLPASCPTTASPAGNGDGRAVDRVDVRRLGPIALPR
jgi:DNA end-binding protein Ku